MHAFQFNEMKISCCKDFHSLRIYERDDSKNNEKRSNEGKWEGKREVVSPVWQKEYGEVQMSRRVSEKSFYLVEWKN